MQVWGSEAECSPLLYRKLEATLGHTKPCLKKKLSVTLNFIDDRCYLFWCLKLWGLPLHPTDGTTWGSELGVSSQPNRHHSDFLVLSHLTLCTHLLSSWSLVPFISLSLPSLSTYLIIYVASSDKCHCALLLLLSKCLYLVKMWRDACSRVGMVVRGGSSK